MDFPIVSWQKKREWRTHIESVSPVLALAVEKCGLQARDCARRMAASAGAVWRRGGRNCNQFGFILAPAFPEEPLRVL